MVEPDAVRTDRVGGAERAARVWGDAPGAVRAKALSDAAQALEARAGEMTDLVVREVGKPLSEARGEIARGVSILRYYAQCALLPDGEIDAERVRSVRDAIDASLIDDVASVPGVHAAVPRIEGIATVVGADGTRIGGGGPPTAGNNSSTRALRCWRAPSPGAQLVTPIPPPPARSAPSMATAAPTPLSTSTSPACPRLPNASI